MRLALAGLGQSPGHVLIDGNQKPGSSFPETAIVDGDARSLSIAAASVVGFGEGSSKQLRPDGPVLSSKSLDRAVQVFGPKQRRQSHVLRNC